ncbi:MAG: decaprenyl-phosphate phosphoribosyltransferase [Chloroflexota bacterium]
MMTLCQVHLRTSRNEVMMRLASSNSNPAIAQVPLLAALRPKQWTKNLLIFAALLFSIRFTQLATWQAAIIAFAAFCLFSSAGYLVNDLLDVEADRQHPTKRLRPIASGSVSRMTALLTIVVLVVSGVALALSLGPLFTAVAIGYLVVSVSYSVWLKHYVLLDLFGIAAGFVLRAAAGAVAITVPISPWLYVCTGLVALFLALGKRRNELILLESSAGQHRRNLDDYTVELVDQLTLIVTAAAVIAYSLYTISGDGRSTNPAMMLTIPFVMYGLFRYLYLVHIRKLGGNPEDLLLQDRPLSISVIAWILTCGAILILTSRAAPVT